MGTHLVAFLAFLAIATTSNVASSFSFIMTNKYGQVTTSKYLLSQKLAGSSIGLDTSLEMERNGDNTMGRREASSSVLKTALFSLFVATATSTDDAAMATTGSIKTAQFAGKGAGPTKTTNDPEVAFKNIKLASLELSKAQSILSKAISSGNDDDVDSLKDFFEKDAINMNNFEGNALVLLQSKKMSDETRKEIGTIRRYGVGADVQIMYGGLISELDASEYPNLGEVKRFLGLCINSLNEVISLCKSDGFE